ncbi:MAG: hypothetical protein QM504_04065, partial [Pseudomonadota bacterium]
IFYFIWQSHDVLTSILKSTDSYFIGFALIARIASHFSHTITSTYILKSINIEIPYRTLLKIHITRLPARYIPGGIWHTVGRMLDFHTLGIKPAKLSFFILLENIVAAAIAFLLSGIILWFYHGIDDYWGKISSLAFIASVLGLTLIPIVINWRKKQINIFYIYTLIAYIPLWFLLTLSFLMYTSAFPIILQGATIVEISGIYMFSWGIGFLAIFAPQGIGIFELIAGKMLTTTISLGSIAVLLMGYRIITIFADLLLWAGMRLVLALITNYRNRISKRIG